MTILTCISILNKIDIRAGLSSAAAAATVGVLEEAPKLEDYTEDMWSKVKVMFKKAE